MFLTSQEDVTKCQSDIALHFQRLAVACHFQIAATDLFAVAVYQLAQALPVDRACGLAAVELLVVYKRFDGVGAGWRLDSPFHRVAGLGRGAFPKACGFESYLTPIEHMQFVLC